MTSTVAAHRAHSPFSFKTVTLNVKSNPLMSQNKVVHDVRRASHEGSLIGWNEISPHRYVQAIKDLGPSWGHYLPHDGGLQIPNPISWKKDVWKMEKTGFVKTHHGLAKVSPNRYITWAKLKHKDSGKEIVRINTHLVSGAFTPGKGHHAWRVEHWKIHMEKLQKLITHFEKQGLTVVVGGDFNRDSSKVLGNHVAYDNKLNVGTHGHSTYDYLMHSKHGNLTRTGVHVDDGFASDHNSVVARYKLKG